MADQPIDEKDVFNHARRIAAPGERMAYLQSACGQDAAALQRIQELLRVHDPVGSFLESSPVARPATIDEPMVELPGAVIGPYKLLEQIGEGGFGVVYMAEQTEPVRRKVALKILKPGMDTRQVVARFEAERQALALMDHPNIAKVFDGGATATGRPYFVMELVKGVPITEYCDQNHLTPRQRLELFFSVCQAVQHAHQKGIIHRDLKPSNILVVMHDTTPAPKVIDFGIAKALGQELTDKTLFTGFAQMVGTPLYMSPEQAGQSGLDIDTRSDIYSLGVLLYELLTGTTPFSKERFKQAAYDEIRRIIREEDPPKPSTRLHDSKDSLPSISAQRQTEPAKLTKLVRGELDWIVMKSLEKDRNRRYETANGFAMDVQRYLADEPVLACPPSMTYRFRKFARRNRAAVLTAAAVLFVLVAGIAGTTFGLIRAEIRFEEAEKARADEAAQRLIADAEKRRAVAAERQTLDDYRASTDDAIEELIGAKPHLSPQDKAYLERTLKRWQAYAARRGDDDWSQALRAEGHSRVAMLLWKLGQREKARAEFETARDLYKKLVDSSPGGSRYQDSLATMHHNLGVQLTHLGQRDAARAEYEAARDLQQKLMAAFPAEPRYSQFLASTHINLGDLLMRLGQIDAAHTEFKTAHDLHKKLTAAFPAVPQYQKSLANSHSSLGSVLKELGHSDAARTELETARDLLKKLVAALPDEIGYQRDLAAVHHNLGMFLGRLGQRDAARTEFEAARDLRKKLVDAFPAVPQYQLLLAATHNNLVPLLKDLGQRDAAAVEHEAALNLQKKLAAAFPAEPDYQVNLGGGCCNHGLLVLNEGRAAESLSWFDLAIRTLTPVYEQDRRAVQVKEFLRNSYQGQGSAYHNLKKFPEAIAAHHKAIELDPNHASVYCNLGITLLVQKNLPEAIAAHHKAIELNPKFALAYMNLGNCLHEQKKLPEAIDAYHKAIAIDPNLANAYLNLGNALMAQGKPDDAVSTYRKAVEVSPNFAFAYNGLGLALMAQGKPDDAIAAYRRAMELDPTITINHIPIGFVAAKLNKVDDAIAFYKKGIEFQPKNVIAHFNLGILLCDRKKDYPGAVAAFRKAISLEPNTASAQAHFNLGYALDLKGDGKEAIASFREAIRLQPTYARAHTNLARCLTTCADIEVRKPQEALEAAKKGVELTPQSDQAWLVLGWAHYRSGEYQASITALEKSAALNTAFKGGNPDHWLFLAMAHWQLDRQDEARRWYDRAVAWMGKYRAVHQEELQRIRTEAEEVLKIKKK